VFQEAADALVKAAGVRRFAFPNKQYVPARLLQKPFILPVPLFVPHQFRAPVTAPRLWDVSVDASRVLMPKASSDFDDLRQFAEN
jgi:hypothetical protein